ncbi:uncharacterized protein LOC110878307 isoform X1 [Helianthus annuus]|uniref:uncharacterized protein LOC110878307 isoform X1 n=1 Tax=Helianthus annuus TaxID=4232 RepID=UPI000B907506|nr:uncharacterized protein LOC110878307 isoform X1 [Helianthus annuus]XP_035833411.1 uncharacterized protein LOC110878307 isoform X1 [Helianthus annuus]XP_035833412.1 uncharacterized protein LOC110878307 isoform X1 [Helianthus annuus]
MECNKDEALRDKKIAEEKMVENDFEGARKFALKAKQLYPELDNISQLITVCDVHCAAQKKIYGAGKDLYGILQVENVADDTTICKQYRKLALVLHPDKNKFPGAEAAFKLIGEANMTLSDREKRSIYDMQCREPAKAFAKEIHNHQGNQTSYAGQQNQFKTAPSSQFNGVSRGQQSTSNPSTRLTFWTQCPFCSVKYEAYREFIQRLLRCQQCSKLFIAFEIFKTAPSSQFNGVSRGQQSTSNPSTRLTFWTQCPFCSVKYESYREFFQRLSRCQQCSKLFIAYEIGPQAHNVNLGSKAQSVNSGSKPVSQQKEAAKVETAKGNIKKDGKVPSNLERKKTEGTRMKQEGVTKPKVSGVRKPMETGTAKATDKRMAAESRGEASSDKTEAAGGGVSGGSPNGKRSSRQRQQASYQEGGAGEFSPSKKSKLSKSSGDVAHADVSTPNGKLKQNGKEAVTPDSHSKKSKLSKSSGDVAPADVSTPNGKLKQNGKEVVTPDSHSKNDPEPELVHCPEQDFTNFDKDKEEHCFAVGQIWACYDSVDAMPRFYAQIRKVYSSKFRLRIAWFESDPDNALEIKWVEEGLPVACGKYELGETEETSDPRIFSHQIVIKKVSKSSYFISPQKGEIWAVYKDWDMKWSMDPENHTKYKFDIVEIVEAGEDCITVGFLLKVKGFVGVFQRSIWAGAGDLKIPCNELFRFSHRIPSAELTGTERAGVPAGSLELDMASLPADFEDYCSYSSNNVNTASKSHEETVKPVPNLVSTPKKRIDKDSTSLTFRTYCPFCSIKYGYYKEYIQRPLRCQQCSKVLIAYEIGPQAHNVNLGSKPVSQQKEAAKVENAKGNIKKDGKDPSNLEHKKTDKKEAAGGGVSGGSPNGKRSSRQRQQASYQEGGAGEFSPSKKSKLSKPSGDVAPADVSTPNGKLKQNGKEVVTPDSHSKNDPEPELVDCPEQDFTNFEKDKEERCFAVGQIWACYDSGDGMPRFYAQIRKVYSSKFRLQIAWFESDPDNALEIKWVEEGLPVACGKHELGETEETSNRLMFSHQMVIKKVSKSSYFISPQKGEIWAVYKDWDMKWSMDPENHTKYKFDIVEIVEAGEDCITVGFLLKVKGFVSVFQRSNWAGAGDHKIPCNERFRFSHRIPSAKLTGTERAGVPAGAFELDMASLPADFEDYCSYSSNNVNTASKSHEETVKPVPNLVSTPKKTEGTRMKQEGVTKPKVSGVRKPMETGTAKATDRRMAAESSEASSDKKEAAGGGVSGGSPNGKRSSQQRQQASYQEGGAGEFSPSKKSKLSKSSGNVAPADVSTPNGKLKQNGKEVVTPDSYSKNDPEPEFVDCPEQDFTNFDKDKEEHCFAVGQIWACYDSVDAMPRFYAQIRKVYSSKFRLQIAWFESDPDNPLEIKWVDEGLPVACGKHVLGETEETSNRLMFSHQMVIKKVSKSSYFISPQKGEIWAIYKDWDMKWSMDPENHTKYKFDIGEIVEAGEDCITVGFLLKVKGFVSVFQRSIRAGAGDHKIPCNERFRFSHRIPSAKLTGTERAGVPAGSFELDMASLPADFEDYCSYSSNNVNTASKSHEETVKPVPNLVSTPKKRIDKDSTPKLRRSPRGLGNQKI